MTRGVLMYAHNNKEIDYFKIACANALMVRKNLDVPTTLVTDTSTLAWGKKSLGAKFIKKCFEKVILVDRNNSFKNQRRYSDTSSTSKSLQFYNCNHWEAYNLSPYDETLFIDADYLIMSSALSNCWDNEEEFMINHQIFSANEKGIYSEYIDMFGIRQYWATVIYFRKTEFAESMFNIVRNVQENYTYYKQLYCFSNDMFRNDYAFSIAVHMVNGYANDDIIKELPIKGLLMSWDTGDIFRLNGINDIIIYVEQPDHSYILTRLQEQDVHIMNKWAINRISDQLIKIYE